MFSVPCGLISDGPNHFRNESVLRVIKARQMTKRFTLLYSPESYEAVESLCREDLRVADAQLFKLRVWLDLWPILLQIFQSGLSQYLFK